MIDRENASWMPMFFWNLRVAQAFVFIISSYERVTRYYFMLLNDISFSAALVQFVDISLREC